MEALPRLAILPRGTELAGPITIGVFRPLVILPENLLDTLDPRGLRDVLVHEFAHALRRDPLVGLLQRLAAAVFWPYPPVHLLNRRLAWAREEVCDNYVLRQGDAAELCRNPADDFRNHSVACDMQPATLGLCHPAGRLEQRVAGMLDPRRNVMVRMHRVALVALTAIFVAAVVLVAGTRLLRAEPPAAPKATAKPAADAAAPVECRAVNKLVKDFPEKLDLSHPESALVAMWRAILRKDALAAAEFVVDSQRKGFVKHFDKLTHDLSTPVMKETKRSMENLEVVEVLTYRDHLAEVICRSPAEDSPLPYAGNLIGSFNGSWVGYTALDATAFPSLEATRNDFEENKEKYWAGFVQAKEHATGGEAPAVETQAASAGTAATVQWRAVNKRIVDFPKKVDMSTPESVLVATCRASRHVSDMGFIYWNHEIMDVFTCRDDIAAVITRVEVQYGEPLYRWSLFAKINGVWKGLVWNDSILEKVGGVLADRPAADLRKEFPRQEEGRRPRGHRGGARTRRTQGRSRQRVRHGATGRPARAPTRPFPYRAARRA